MIEHRAACTSTCFIYHCTSTPSFLAPKYPQDTAVLGMKHRAIQTHQCYLLTRESAWRNEQVFSGLHASQTGAKKHFSSTKGLVFDNFLFCVNQTCLTCYPQTVKQKSVLPALSLPGADRCSSLALLSPPGEPWQRTELCREALTWQGARGPKISVGK